MDFINEYFINPIATRSGYNIVNTSVFALAFVAVVALTVVIFRKFRIKIDKSFFIGLFPFIILGSVCRSLEDAAVLKGFWFVTPGLYVLVYLAVLASLAISLRIEKDFGVPYWKMMASAGAVMAVFAFSFAKIIYFQPLLYVIAISAGFFLAIFGIRKFLKPKLLSMENSCILLAHLFDASTTFTAVELSSAWLSGIGYVEQHVLAGFLMGAVGNYAIFLLKLAVIPIALFILDSNVDEKNSRNFLKLAVFILGFGPGLRNLLSMMMGV